MGAPTSWARINFPAARLDDEVKAKLKETADLEMENDTFKPLSIYSSMEIEVVDGIFSLDKEFSVYPPL